MYNVLGYRQSGTLSYTYDTENRITDFMVVRNMAKVYMLRSTVVSGL